MTLARRYGPLLAVAAVQLLIIAVVPSRAPGAGDASQTALNSGRGGPTVNAEGLLVDPVTGQVIDPATGLPVGSSTGPGGGTTAGSGGGGGGGGGTGGDGRKAGDTSHCVNGRQYNPAVYEHAPPCVGKWVGDNGGATYNRGVTKDTVKVVFMRGNYGVLVNRVLESQGSLPTNDEFDSFLEAAEKFVNARYELYGRKVDFKRRNFQAITGGEKAPDDKELRAEAQRIVREENPFAVLWANPVSSATYDEFSRLKVVNIGGYGFTDKFNVDHRPYHWDVQMGGYQLADNVAAWYCNRMYGGGTAKASYAGGPKRPTDDPRRGPDLRPMTRNLGVITTNDPENVELVAEFKRRLGARCGAKVEHQFEYEQNIQTLQQQRMAALSAMNTPSNPATTVMCFCDQVAPTFLYKSCSDQDYYPEHVMVASGLMDLDRVAQEYDHGAEYPNAEDNEYPQFENAFGLGQFARTLPMDQMPPAQVWRAGGGTGPVPYDDVVEDWHYYAMIASLIQGAGPTLTPANVEAGAARLGVSGSLLDESQGQHSLIGDYTWKDSLREIYFTTRPSRYNGHPGSYLSLGGGRWYMKGGFPTGLLALPPKPR